VIICLYSFNWMVLITEEYVYCGVRAEYLTIIRVNLTLQMVNTSLSSSVARSEMTGVAAMMMKVGQRQRNRD
jgi:hypothetical protein